MKKILIGPIIVYQWTLGLLWRNNCRFYPTCSNYALEAINKHGALKGAWHSFSRLIRCHPWHLGGWDPVQ